MIRGLNAGRRADAEDRTRPASAVGRRPSGSPTCSSTRWPGRPRTCACARRSRWRSTATRIITALLQGYGKPVEHRADAGEFRLRRRTSRAGRTIPRARRALVKEAGAEGATLPFLTSPAYDRRHDRGDAADARRCRPEGDDRRRSTSRPSCARRQGTPEEAGSLVAGPLVLRLPGRGRRHLSAVPHRAASGRSIPTRHSTRRSMRRAADARRGAAARRITTARSRSCATTCRASACTRTSRSTARRARSCSWTPTPNEAFFIMDMSWQPDDRAPGQAGMTLAAGASGRRVTRRPLRARPGRASRSSAC